MSEHFNPVILNEVKNLFRILLALPLVALSCGKGDEPSSGSKSLEAPKNLTVKSVTENSVTIQWDPVEGAKTYRWSVSQAVSPVVSGGGTNRNATVTGLSAGTTYRFSVSAASVSALEESVTSAESSIDFTTEGSATPVIPVADAVCVDAPIVVSFDAVPVLGTSGKIKVFAASGKQVDEIDLADIATVDILGDGTMIPKGADADHGLIAIGNDYVFNTFMDALHSAQYRVVHYTPLRINGKKLEIKLHNEALDFNGSYYVTIDESVAGKAVAAGDLSFTTKARPSGTTLSVNPDGSADFCTVQGALSYASANIAKDEAVTVEVARGTYRELLFLRNKNNVTIKGADREKTLIVYPNNDSYETGSGGSVASRPHVGSSIGKSGGRSLFLVEGCDNLRLENLTIENSYSIPSHKGQAETVYFNSNYRLTVENCSLLSWQDTFLTKGKVWVHNSLIAGHVDFIWGYPEACLFEDCEIRARAGGYLIQARVPSASNKGFVFLNCRITAGEGVKDGSMYLARSGGSTDYYDNVTFVNCQMSSVVAPVGWYSNPAPNPATPTAVSGWKEYGTTGVSTASRNSLGRILTADEAAAYSSKEAVLGW